MPKPPIQLVANTASGRLNALDAAIAGLVDGGIVEYDSKYVSMPLVLAQRLVNTKAVSTYVVRLKDSSRRDTFAAALQRDANAKGAWRLPAAKAGDFVYFNPPYIVALRGGRRRRVLGS